MELGWLRTLRGVARFVGIAAGCLAVAVTVIALIPGSPVTARLPGSMLTGLEGLGGLRAGVTVDPAGGIALDVADPSIGQRTVALLGVLPGLLLVAEITRRLSRLLPSRPDQDPFTAATARQLQRLAKVTAFGGLAVWACDLLGQWALSSTVAASGAAVLPDRTPLVWLAVGLLFEAFGRLVAHGVGLRAELDTVV